MARGPDDLRLIATQLACEEHSAETFTARRNTASADPDAYAKRKRSRLFDRAKLGSGNRVFMIVDERDTPLAATIDCTLDLYPIVLSRRNQCAGKYRLV